MIGEYIGGHWKILQYWDEKYLCAENLRSAEKYFTVEFAAMSRILMTMNEDAQSSRAGGFAVTYRVDEHDCLEYAAGLEALGHDVYFINWDDLDGRQFGRMFHVNAGSFVDPVLLEDFDLIWVYQMEGFYADRARFLRMIEIFEDAWEDSEPVADPSDWKWAEGRHLIDYVFALEESLGEKLSKKPSAPLASQSDGEGEKAPASDSEVTSPEETP